FIDCTPAAITARHSSQRLAHFFLTKPAGPTTGPGRGIDLGVATRDNQEKKPAAHEWNTMARKVQKTSPGEGKRKRRTREHVIAALSAHHVEGLALRCGYTVERVVADYGYDLLLATYNEGGEVEGAYVLLQLKASDSLPQYELAQEEVFSFPVSARD